MTEPKVRVDRQLLRLALADAIKHQQSVLGSHNGYLSSGEPGDAPHCQPGTRCGAYQEASGRVQKYQRELALLDQEKPARPYRVRYKFNGGPGRAMVSHHASEDSAAEKYGLLRRTGVGAWMEEWKDGAWVRVARNEIYKRGYRYAFEPRLGDQGLIDRLRVIPF